MKRDYLSLNKSQKWRWNKWLCKQFLLQIHIESYFWKILAQKIYLKQKFFWFNDMMIPNFEFFFAFFTRATLLNFISFFDLYQIWISSCKMTFWLLCTLRISKDFSKDIIFDDVTVAIIHKQKKKKEVMISISSTTLFIPYSFVQLMI